MSMGLRDSSLTRVQPAFRQLAERDDGWLATLCSLGSRSSQLLLPSEPDWPGPLLSPPGFEYGCLAPGDYLVYLIEHASDPGLLDHSQLAASSGVTYRKRLLAGNRRVRQEALQRLGREGGTRPGGGQWQVLEGITKVDCAVFASNMTLFIEGKRTEEHLTDRVWWNPNRNQVVRNLDCLRADPDRADRWYVLLVAEAGSNAEVEASQFDQDMDTVRRSLPHLAEHHVEELWSHYLGYTTWQAIADTFDLDPYPDTTRHLG